MLKKGQAMSYFSYYIAGPVASLAFGSVIIILLVISLIFKIKDMGISGAADNQFAFNLIFASVFLSLLISVVYVLIHIAVSAFQSINNDEVFIPVYSYIYQFILATATTVMVIFEKRLTKKTQSKKRVRIFETLE